MCSVYDSVMFASSSSIMEPGFSIFAVRRAEGDCVPLLVLDGRYGQWISADVVAYVRVLALRGDSYARMDAACGTLGLLYAFYVRAYRGEAVDPKRIPTIVAAFLNARRRGTLDLEGNDPTGLGWSPAKRQTIANDRRYIAEYSEFCVVNQKLLPLDLHSSPDWSPQGKLYDSLSRLARRRGNSSTDLLVHLAEKRKPKHQFLIDVQEASQAVRSGGRSKHFMSRGQVDDMIDRTSSLIQRMLLILAFFGGPRLSEILNMWRCDVLPGRLRQAVFADDRPSSIPLVLLAHPSSSTYVGDFGLPAADRMQVLRRMFGQMPRHLVRPDPLWAGWKGMQFDDFGRHLAQVYWTDLRMAEEFYALHTQVRAQIHPMIESSILKSHPYLIINDSVGGREFGKPMKLSNARKVFVRAAARIGIDSDTFRDGSHGGRHFYKSSLDKLGLDKSDVQKCMHHAGAASQDVYGRELETLRATLQSLLGAPLMREAA